MYHFTLFLLGLCFHSANLQVPPRVTGSYKAWGEIVQNVPDMPGELVQEAFEESYDADTQNAAFRVWETGKNVTLIENFRTNQTYRYTQEDPSQPTTCDTLTLDSWKKSKLLEFNEGYEYKKGVVRFALKQFFELPDIFLTPERNVLTTFRNITARKWFYELRPSGNMTVVSAYWSEPDWSTTSPQESVPLGFVVTTKRFHPAMKSEIVREVFINIYGFVPNTYDHKLFEPVQGVVCPGRAGTLKFPDVSKWKSVALHSEMVLPEYREIKYVDTWLHPEKALLRIDLERIVEEDPLEFKEKKFQSEIAVGVLGVVYRKTFFKGNRSCEVISSDNYKNDPQNFFNVKGSPKHWRPDKLFGSEKTSYVYIGKTVKGDIPCNLFQATRTDWPDAESNVTSLWEWCFNVNMAEQDTVLFVNGEFGLVSAQVNILKSNNPFFSVGLRMFHHFYEVTDKSPSVLLNSVFDISDCYSPSQYRALQFHVNWTVTEDNKEQILNTTANKEFLYKWRVAISLHSGVGLHSLRVSYVKAIIIDEDLVIQFLLLDLHPDLPDIAKKDQKTAADAEKTLTQKIHLGKVNIRYKPDPKSEVLSLGVVPGTLRPQIVSDFNPQTVDPTAKPTPTSSTARQSSTTSEKPKRDKRIEYVGHQQGAVAGVSIAMLLIGLTIGSGGTFVKFNGLPAWLTRR